MTRHPLYFLSLHSAKMSLEFMRKVKDEFPKSDTVKEHPWPDCLCYLRGYLVLRGEEKRSPADLPEMGSELTERFGEWSATFYGKLPFVFAYATGGIKIKYRRYPIASDYLANIWLAFTHCDQKSSVLQLSLIH